MDKHLLVLITGINAGIISQLPLPFSQLSCLMCLVGFFIMALLASFSTSQCPCQLLSSFARDTVLVHSCAYFQEPISGATEGRREMEQAHLVSLAHTLPASKGHWHPKRTTYPMDDCWELVSGRSARCAEPMEKSRRVAKEFCCSLCCFQTGYCQKAVEAIPCEAIHAHSLQAKCLLLSFICLVDKYSSYFKK